MHKPLQKHQQSPVYVYAVCEHIIHIYYGYMCTVIILTLYGVYTHVLTVVALLRMRAWHCSVRTGLGDRGGE